MHVATAVLSALLAFACVAGGCSGEDEQRQSADRSSQTTAERPASQSSSVPNDAVAMVGSVAIPEQEFTRLVRVGCVKAVVTAPTTDASADSDSPIPCADQYEQVKQLVLTRLVTAQWYDAEAKVKGVRFDIAQARKEFNGLIKDDRYMNNRWTYERYRLKTGIRKRDFIAEIKYFQQAAALRGTNVRFDEYLRDKFRSRTVCREELVTDDCANG